MKKFAFAIVLLSFSLAVCAADIKVDRAYLLGAWNIKGIKASAADEFRPPLQPGKLEFTNAGKMIETLGHHGAQIHWNYSTDGENIFTKFATLSKSWKVLAVDDKELIIQHHLGIFQLRRTKR